MAHQCCCYTPTISEPLDKPKQRTWYCPMHTQSHRFSLQEPGPIFFMNLYQKPTKASLSHCTLLQLFPFLFELNHTMAKLKSLAHAVYSDWWKRSNESLPHHPACTWAQSLLLYLCVQRPCSKTHTKQQKHQVLKLSHLSHIELK